MKMENYLTITKRKRLLDDNINESSGVQGSATVGAKVDDMVSKKKTHEIQ